MTMTPHFRFDVAGEITSPTGLILESNHSNIQVTIVERILVCLGWDAYSNHVGS